MWSTGRAVARAHARASTKLCYVVAENEDFQMQAAITMSKEEMQSIIPQYYRHLRCFAWMVVAAM